MSAREIWVFADKSEAIGELIAGARELGDQIVALLIGGKAEADAAIRLGADRVLCLGGGSAPAMVEDCVDTVAELAAERKPAVLLVRATRRGRLIAGRLAAILNTAVLTDVKELAADGGGVVATHLLFGGGANRTERSTGEIAIATVGSGVYKPLDEDGSRTGEIVDVPLKAPAWQIKVVERRGRGSRSVDLSAAKKVVGVGRGFGKKEDLSLAEELARLLEAEIGCSRPMAEGVDWLPKERYIGVSGATVKADLYLTVGISGQTQHMIGAGDSRLVAAINKDKAAPIFSQVDYGIVGDLYKVVPLLVSQLKGSR